VNGRLEGSATGDGRVYQAAGDQYVTEQHIHGGDPADWAGPGTVRRPPTVGAPLVLRDRDDVLRQLKAALTPDAPGNRVLVLHGLGGCGKTAVARAAFAFALVEGGRVGLWVDASEPSGFRARMLAVAADRGAGDGELMAARAGLRAAADLVWDRLDDSADPWLLVVDGADDPALLVEDGWLRGSPRGIVLVTTRRSAVHQWPGGELHHIGVLPAEAAVEVLQDLAPGSGTPEEAAEVAERLGHLPLALTLVGGFLAAQLVEPWTLARYSDQLDSLPGAEVLALLDQGTAPDSRAGQSVTRTWQVSLAALEGQGLPESVDLLRLLACWSSRPLPLSLLRVLAGSPDRGSLDRALRGLLDHSLTALQTAQPPVPATPPTLHTHAVLLDAVAAGTPEDRRQQLLRTAARALLSVLPEVPVRTAGNGAVSDLAPHVQALLRRSADWGMGQSGPDGIEAVLDCALRTATALHRASDYRSAQSLAEQASAHGTAQLGGDHPLVLRLRQRMSRSSFRLGHAEESLALAASVLDNCERTLGADAADTLESYLCLSIPLREVSGSAHGAAEAAELIRRAVRGRTSLFGPLHPLTLLARKHLLGLPPGPELDQAAVDGAQLLADCQAALGPEHTITLAVGFNYAYALHNTRFSQAAVPMAERAVAAHRRTYGEEYPLTLAARYLLADTLASTGHRGRAAREFQAVAEARARSLGPDHPWTRTAEQAAERLQGDVR
jgi:hypothetical protein